MNTFTRQIVSIILIVISFTTQTNAKPMHINININKFNYNINIFKTKLHMPKVREPKIKTKRKRTPSTQNPRVTFRRFLDQTKFKISKPTFMDTIRGPANIPLYVDDHHKINQQPNTFKLQISWGSDVKPKWNFLTRR